jgi:hypothetical protein
VSVAVLEPVRFHFDHLEHVYTVDDQVKPHITGMLANEGIIDDTWFTEESCDRGIAVHDLTAAYDLGAIDPRTLVSSFRGFLLGHVKAMQLLRPTMLAVEEPEVHPRYLFGGRPDRVCVVKNVKTILEIKSGVKPRRIQYKGRWTTAHEVQTALQAILVAWRYRLEPQMFQRIAAYYKSTGKYDFEMHRERGDFDSAMQVLKECGCVR